MEDNNHKPVTKDPPPSSHLIPSQALQPGAPSSQKSENGNVDNNNNKRNNRKRRNNKAKNGGNNSNPKNSPPLPTDQQNVDDTTMNTSGNKNNNKGGKDQQQRRRKQKHLQLKRGNEKADNDADNKNDNSKEGNSSKKLNNPKRKQKKNKKKYPWRRHIPKGSVDPITLENLQTLEYPPFALVADEPYVSIPEWPIILGSSTPGGTNNDNDKDTNTKKDVNVENLNRQRLAEQWGMDLLPSKKGVGIGEYTTTEAAGNTKASPLEPSHIPLSERPLNLFDGRALAFYMVSQLQFIDPLTRRDLTRPELVNLDRYLVRHGCDGSGVGEFNNNGVNRQRKNNKKEKQILVTDAYDAKGITISSAGAAATTAQGRTDIMQQMAQQLLNSLFVGQSVSTLTPTNNSNRIERDASTRRQRNVDERHHQQEQQQFLERQQAESFTLQEQYDVMQRQERASAAVREQQYEPGFGDAGNYYHDRDIGGGGFTIIDDDENPQLRGRNGFPSLSTTIAATENSRYGDITDSSPFYSASHIAGRHGGNGPQMMGAAFPSLPSASSTNNSSSPSYLVNDAEKINNNNSNVTEKSSSKAKKSKTLAKISGIVKKTTSEEKQKQWEAREAARRKALMSNLTFGSNPTPSLLTSPIYSVDGSGSVPSATEEQMQRNRAFAEALGVKPAAQRHYASGWSRPTEVDEDEGANNELLHELDTALYPDVIVAQARDLMPLLLKLEKKWKRFLNDDKAASLPLNHMVKPFRAFVHHYAEFWNLKTESFDSEPKRYVHCVKLQYTRMPRPLLSEVATRCRVLISLPDATRTLYDSLPNSTRTLSGHTSQQTAGQTSKSRELPPPPNRVPLPLKTRSVSPTAVAFSERPFRAVTGMSSRKGISIPEGTAQNSRSDALMDKERPQLELLPRSVPLELPPFEQQQQSTATYDAEEDLKKRQARLLERRQRDKIIEEKKKKVLLEAFASDDDEDKINSDTVDSDSEWGEEQEPFYVGSDEE